MELMCAILRLFWTTRHVSVLMFTFALHKSLTHYRVIKMLSSGMLYFVVYQTTRCHAPENISFNIRRRENLSLLLFESWDFMLLVIRDFSCLPIFENIVDGSRLKNSNKMQQYANIYLLVNYSTCFGCPSRPSSGVLLTMGAMDAWNM